MRLDQTRQPALSRRETALWTALTHTPLSGRRSLLRGMEGWIPAAAQEVRPAPAQRRGSAAGRAVLSAAGISLPGVSAMRRGSRAPQDRQALPALGYGYGYMGL